MQQDQIWPDFHVTFWHFTLRGQLQQIFWHDMSEKGFALKPGRAQCLRADYRYFQHPVEESLQAGFSFYPYFVFLFCVTDSLKIHKSFKCIQNNVWVMC